MIFTATVELCVNMNLTKYQAYYIYAVSQVVEDNMALILIRKRWRRDEEYISLSGAHRRILLFKRVYELMRERMGKDFEFVELYVDNRSKSRFWMRPSDKDGMPIGRTGKNKIVTVTPMLEALGWSRKETVRAPVTWDGKNKAFLVDLKKAITVKGSGAKN